MVTWVNTARNAPTVAGLLRTFGQRRARDPGYVSASVLVPIGVLMRGMAGAMLV